MNSRKLKYMILVIAALISLLNISCSRVFITMGKTIPTQVTCTEEKPCIIEESFNDFMPLFEAEGINTSNFSTVAIYKSHGCYFFTGENFTNVWVGKPHKKGLKLTPVLKIEYPIFTPEYLTGENVLYLAYYDGISKHDTLEIMKWEE